MIPSSAAALLTALGWSTAQGDEAVAGHHAAHSGDPVSVCPWPFTSSLAHPWRAGWVAASAAQVAPELATSRRTGSFRVILRANGACAELATRVHADLIV